MSLLDRWRGKAITAPVGKDSRGWSLLQGSWPTRWQSSETLFGTPSLADAEAAYAHPIVRACVQEIATTASEPRIELGIWTSPTEWQPLETQHWLTDLFDAPTLHESCEEMIEAWVTRLTLTGLGYLWKLRNKGNQIDQLLSIPSSWVSPTFERRGGQLYQGFKIHGQKGTVTPEDLAVTKHLDPSSITGAIGPYHAAQRDHALDVERENYLAEMLVNLKVPGLVVTVKDGFGKDDERRKEAKRDIRNSVGRGNRGNTLLLEGDVTTEVHNPLGDLDWPGFSNNIDARICMAFQVPAILVGARLGLLRSTYANYESARQSFYRETMGPLWKKLAGSLTRSLLRAEGEPRLQVRFAYEDLPEFREGEDALALRVLNLYRGGLISREEARGALGYDPEFPDSDKADVVPDVVDEAADEAQQEEEVIPEGKVRGNGHMRRKGKPAHVLQTHD